MASDGFVDDVLSVFEILAEKKIREAIERGDFEDLPGKGKPLQLEDDSHIPSDLRIAYKILKNANCLPQEILLRKEIQTTEELLAGIKDTQEKYHQMKKLNYLIMKLNMIRPVSPLLEEGQRYYELVLEKVAKPKEKK